jgi:carbon-monoxide dehydrogenase medium subunit
MGPPLLVLDAALSTVSALGERTIPVKRFFRGVKANCCGPAEIVTEIRVPAGRETVSVFSKRTRIRGHDLSLVNGAAACENGAGLRIALGAVGPTPILVESVNRWGLGERKKIIREVMKSVSPIDDVRSSRSYRRAMARFTVGALLDGLLAGGGEG